LDQPISLIDLANQPRPGGFDLKHLHATLGIERVVFTQPSVYGTDNSAILDAMAALNAETPDRARAVVALADAPRH